MNISVIGAGGWGTTLAILLYYNGHNVTLWEFDPEYAELISRTRCNDTFLQGVKIPEEILITNSLTNACEKQQMIVLAVPSQFMRKVIQKIKLLDISDTILVSVSKGIETGTLMTISQIIKDEMPELPEKYIAVISGPSHAEEVSRKIPTTVVAASYDAFTCQEVQVAFSTSYFRVYSSSDIYGVELGGSLKNVIAIGAGIIDGAGFGDNTKAAIMTRGVAELSRLGTALGTDPRTFTGLSGMGDLIVTCGSKHSRNRYVGEQIGKGLKLPEVLKSMKMVAEGVETCRAVHQLSLKYNIELPIASAVYSILFEDKDPIKATFELMTREIKSEY